MKPIILFHKEKIFKDRYEAGVLLGQELQKRMKEKPLVLGIPRGGMVVASAIASVLDCDVDVMLTHKIGAPYNPELAIGAVSEDGRLYLNDSVVKTTGATRSYIERTKQEQLGELNRRQKLFRSVYPKIPLKGRVVVITDDGIATGATVQAALWAARHEKPAQLIGAFPVAPPDTLERLARDADAMICLSAPETFRALSPFYMSFSQVSDEEVLDILKQEYERKHKRG